MKNKFYKYVKKLTNFPCSSYFQLSKLNINEDQLVAHINLKYKMDIINFEKNSDYKLVDNNAPVGTSTEYRKEIYDVITYHFKINSLLYLEYKVVNTNLLKSNDYTLIDMTVYSSLTNQKELILFLQYISDYVNK